MPTETPKAVPFLSEAFSDNGAHSHWKLIDPITGENLWSEDPEEDAATGHPVSNAELQRLRGLLDEATDMLYEGAGYADEVTDSEGADEFARRARTFLAKLKK